MFCTKNFLCVSALILTGVVFVTCKKEEDKIIPPLYDPSPDISRYPVAKLNEDTTIIYPQNQAYLDGSKSYDPRGNALRFTWRQISGPRLIYTSLQDWNQQNRAAGEIVLYELGTYSIELTVSTNSNYKRSDTINISYETDIQKHKILFHEYGLNTPIPGVDVDICFDPIVYNSTCGGQLQKFKSDNAGYVSFSAWQFSVKLKNLESLGYWEFIPGSIGFYSSNRSPYLDPGYLVDDSINIKLVPKVDIPVRIIDKRILTPQTNMQYLSYGVLLDGGTGIDNTLYRESLIGLRPGIDTSFRLSVYGNMVNGFAVAEIWDNYQGTAYPYGDILFLSEKRFTRSTTDTLYIKY
jgi:hypothetical protein